MMTGRCEFLHSDGECWAGHGTCPHSFKEGALHCPSFIPHQPDTERLSSFQKQAKWADVAAKGRAIYEAGGVEITRNDSYELDALVMSGDVADRFPVTDGGPYPVTLAKTAWSGAPNYGGWVQAYFCECFVPETEILMANGGTRRICDINVGNHVLTSSGGDSPKEGELVSRKVVGAKWRRHFGFVRVISLANGGGATCTEEHPWWVRRDGKAKWLDAEEVRKGDEVLSPSSEGLAFVKVTATELRAYDGIVCNLEIEGEHTYVAGGCLVHNCTWGQYHSGRPGYDGRFGGRMCSHAYAAMLAADARARKDFMNDRTAGLLGTCEGCGEYASLNPVNGLCRDCEDTKTFDAFVAAVCMRNEAAEKWLESEGDPDVIDTIDSQMTFEDVDDSTRVARWNGHRAIVSNKVASRIKSATRKFTYAEMKELDEEIDGRPLHNRSRLKAITEDL